MAQNSGLGFGCKLIEILWIAFVASFWLNMLDDNAICVWSCVLMCGFIRKYQKDDVGGDYLCVQYWSSWSMSNSITIYRRWWVSLSIFNNEWDSICNHIFFSLTSLTVLVFNHTQICWIHKDNLDTRYLLWLLWLIILSYTQSTMVICMVLS